MTASKKACFSSYSKQRGFALPFTKERACASAVQKRFHRSTPSSIYSLCGRSRFVVLPIPVGEPFVKQDVLTLPTVAVVHGVYAVWAVMKTEKEYPNRDGDGHMGDQ